MADRTKTLEDLGALQGSTDASRLHPAYAQKLDTQGRAYATGKRKNAVARVWIKPGAGKIVGQRQGLQRSISPVPCCRCCCKQPLQAANRLDQFDIMATVTGGGLSGQAGAVRHGISKALTYFEPELRGVLKKGGFLTRDSRVVERKKYGAHESPPQLPVLQALNCSWIGRFYRHAPLTGRRVHP